MNLIIIIAAFVILLSAAPVHITQQNFKTHFNVELSDFKDRENSHQWFIMFHSPTCGYCKKAMPEFIKLSTDTSVQQITKLGLVDCKQQKNLCQYFGIAGFPQFVIFTTNKQYFRYKGKERTIEVFKQFISNPRLASEDIQEIQIDRPWWTPYVATAKAEWKTLVIVGTVFPTIFGVLYWKFLTWFLAKRSQNKKKDEKNKQSQQGEKKEENKKTE